jgi:hypothetical protein
VAAASTLLPRLRSVLVALPYGGLFYEDSPKAEEEAFGESNGCRK